MRQLLTKKRKGEWEETVRKKIGDCEVAVGQKIEK